MANDTTPFNAEHGSRRSTHIDMLRDRFAAIALKAALESRGTAGSTSEVARFAYSMADAMIRRRNAAP